MSKEKIKETVTAAGGTVGAAGGNPFGKKVKRSVSEAGKPFSIGGEMTSIAIVGKERKGKKNGGKGNKVEKPILAPVGSGVKKALKNKKNIKESKSEQTLREAIRSLVFLNRVKYHEEQVKRELQEQKVRKIIRYLIKEANAPEAPYQTTGEEVGKAFLDKITVTYDQYTALKSKESQRAEFERTYLAGLKNYLDRLDQVYFNAIPGSREQAAMGGKPAGAGGAGPQTTSASPAGAPTPAMPAPQPAAGAEAPLAEAVGKPKVNPVGTRPSALPMADLDTSSLIKQTTAGLQQNMQAQDPHGHAMALDALDRDLPQVATAGYNSLTFDPFEKDMYDAVTNSYKKVYTSDRREFRLMILGDNSPGVTPVLGNIANRFQQINNTERTKDKQAAPEQTPPLGTGTTPNIGGGANAPQPATGETTPADLGL